MIRALWAKLVAWGWDYSYELTDRGRDRLDLSVVSDDAREVRMPDPLRVKIQRAQGGVIVETTHYDHKKDEETVRIHILHDNTDIGDNISKIVTMELLRLN